MHDNRSKTASDLATQLREALRALAKGGSASPSDLLFEAPAALRTLKSFELEGSGLPLEEYLAGSIEDAVNELPAPDRKAAEILLGLTPSARGKKIGVRREQAAKVLGVTTGTFRNRHENRLIDHVAKKLAAILLLTSKVSQSTAENEPRTFSEQHLRATSERAFGFWSYVRDDDAGDGGRVSALSKDLRTQYRMLTAEKLELFIDRELIEWGQEWDRLISNAIAGATFFIPIITPSYFRSNACRQELLKFVREADKVGLQRLLMPVYWITVPALENEGIDAGDEAIRAIAKHQWCDLREVRLEDRASSAYRKAVNGLAGDIAKRASEVVNSVDDLPTPLDATVSTVVETVEDADDGPGLLDRLADGDEAMEVIAGVMASIGEDIELIGELAASTAGEMQTAQTRGQGTKYALAITERLAQKLDDPASRMEERGREYADLLMRLDSGIQTRLDLLEEQDEPLTEEQLDYLGELESLANNADVALDSLESLVTNIDPIARVSRSLRAPVRKMRGGLQGILDGRAVMADWGIRAKKLRNEERT